jgi:phospholipid/cholesterol/gamma-HCH transport system substrate-binding protein
MVVAIQGVFNKDIRDDLTASIRSIRSTMSNLENTTQNLDTFVTLQSGRLSSIIYNIDMITKNLNNNSGEINRIIDNLAMVSDTLARANIAGVFRNVDNAVSNLADVVEKIDKGDGTLSLLIRDDRLYKELEKSASELNLLLEDIRVNPKRYVRVSVF